MSSLAVLGLLWGLAAVVMCGGWLWQRRRRNAGIADVLWSALLAVCALALAWWVLRPLTRRA